MRYWAGSWNLPVAQVKKDDFLVWGRHMKKFFLTLFILSSLRVGAFNEDIEVISLGYRCQVALHLRFNDLRRAAYPFDWLITPFESLYSLLENDFDGFLDEENIELRLDFPYEDDGGYFSAGYSHVWESRYNVLFGHDFLPFTKDFLKSYEKIREKYERRMAPPHDVI